MRHRDYKTSARLFLPYHLSGSFASENTCHLPENQIHYLRNVLRLTPGTQVIVFNGKDGEWLATLTELTKKRGIITLKKELRPYQPTSSIWAIFAPIKKTRLDFMIEKATELGAGRLVPIQTEHCQVSRIKHDRMIAQAIEASEQCERLDVPDISNLQSLSQLLDTWPQDRKLIVCAEKGKTLPIAQAITKIGNKPAAILVGPEGGFSDAEIEKIASCSFVIMVDLGERILRAETALITALACYQTLND